MGMKTRVKLEIFTAKIYTIPQYEENVNTFVWHLQFVPLSSGRNLQMWHSGCLSEI